MKFIPSQAKTINKYKGLRLKIINCNANILFNKQCIAKKQIPKYARIKVPKTPPAAYKTQQKHSRLE
jgi:hypothetical protein